MIPPVLIRTIPATVDAVTEALWDAACALHPDWEHVTYREPIDPDEFPLTGPAWPLCQSGAQKAGLIRLEALHHHGGIYLDSDVVTCRTLDSLLGLQGFAAWEDSITVPDAVLAAEAGHPAIRSCIDLALARLASRSGAWRDGSGAWATGPGVTTTILPGRDDFTLLPPGAFYPVHYSEKDRLDGYEAEPWVFGIHLWHGSWLTETGVHA